MTVVDRLVAPPEPVAAARVPLVDVRPSPANPRHTLGDLEGLTASVKERGVLQPITVYATSAIELAGDVTERWTVSDGHRRYAASIDAGADDIPVTVVPHPSDDSQARIDRMVANLHRLDLSAHDEGDAYQSLVGEGLTQRAIAEAVGVNQSHVSKRIQLVTIGPDLLARIDRDELTIEDGLTIAKCLKGDPDLTPADFADVNGHVIRQTWHRIQQLEARHTAYRDAVKAQRDPTSDQLPVLEPKSDDGYQGPDGMVPVDGWEWRGLKVTRDQALAAGHLAVFITSHGDTQEVLTHPKKYKTRANRQHTVDPTQKAWDVARQSRHAFIPAMLDRRPTPNADGVLAAVLPIVLDYLNGTELHTLTDALGLDLTKSSSVRVRRDAIATWLDSAGIAGPRKILDIVVTCRPERHMNWGSPAATDETKQWMRTLVDAGYEPAKVEADWIAKHAPPPDSLDLAGVTAAEEAA